MQRQFLKLCQAQTYYYKWESLSMLYKLRPQLPETETTEHHIIIYPCNSIGMEFDIWSNTHHIIFQIFSLFRSLHIVFLFDQYFRVNRHAAVTILVILQLQFTKSQPCIPVYLLFKLIKIVNQEWKQIALCLGNLQITDSYEYLIFNAYF